MVISTHSPKAEFIFLVLDLFWKTLVVLCEVKVLVIGSSAWGLVMACSDASWRVLLGFLKGLLGLNSSLTFRSFPFVQHQPIVTRMPSGLSAKMVVVTRVALIVPGLSWVSWCPTWANAVREHAARFGVAWTFLGVSFWGHRIHFSFSWVTSAVEDLKHADGAFCAK